MQGIHDIGFAQDEQGYYTTRRVSDDDVLTLAATIFEHRFTRGDAIQNAQDAAQLIRHRLAAREHEVFAVIWLDTRHRFLGYDELFRGTIGGTAVYPREVVKVALRANASAALIAHNHPSGVCEPSPADEVLTTKIKQALEIIDVRLLDHLIVAGEGVVSFSERGLL